VAEASVLAINQLVYAEVSVGYARIEELERALPEDVFRREQLPYEAAFLAGKAFLAYRRRGGGRSVPLPDFYIGAHAAVVGYRLLTKDVRRYRIYFPTVRLIAPDHSDLRPCLDHGGVAAPRRDPGRAAPLGGGAGVP
jgi:predicted nucleic acid-binding protein